MLKLKMVTVYPSLPADDPLHHKWQVITASYLLVQACLAAGMRQIDDVEFGEYVIPFYAIPLCDLLEQQLIPDLIAPYLEVITGLQAELPPATCQALLMDCYLIPGPHPRLVIDLQSNPPIVIGYVSGADAE